MIRLTSDEAQEFLNTQRQIHTAPEIDNVPSKSGNKNRSGAKNQQNEKNSRNKTVVRAIPPPELQSSTTNPTHPNVSNAPHAPPNHQVTARIQHQEPERRHTNHGAMDLSYVSLEAKHRTYRHIPVELRAIWTNFLDELLQELASIKFASHERVPALVRQFLDIPATYLRFTAQKKRKALQSRITEAHEQLKKARKGKSSQEESDEENSNSIENDERRDLTSENAELGAPPKPSRAKATEETARKKKALAVINSVKAGECGRACDKLIRQPLAPLNEKTVEALKLLHPSCKQPINPNGDDFDGNSFTYFDSAEVFRAIKQSSKGSAPGRSGWCAELLLSSWDSFCLRTAVTNLINWMANGSLSDEALRNKLLACRLFALSKETPTDKSATPKVRPIAVSEIFIKLLSSLFLKKITIDKLMPDLQYGVKCRGGIENVLHSINHILAADPNAVALSIDFKNAFNSLSRKQILKQIQSNEETKCLLNYFLWSHEKPTPLLLENQDGSVYATLKSAEGTRQGDALSTFLFAWGWYPALVSTNEILQGDHEDDDDDEEEETIKAPAITTAIIDDTTLTGRIDRVSKAFKHLIKETNKLNLSIQTSKCKILVPRPESMLPQELEKVQAFANEHKIPIVNKNTETLGALIGLTNEDDASLCKHQETILEQLQEIQKLSTHATAIPGGIQSLLLLVRMCINQTMNYFIRTTPTSIALKTCDKLDKKIEQTVCVLLDLDPTLFVDHAQYKLRLPIREGGAGITSIANTASSAYIASSCNAARTIHKTIKWRKAEARRTKQDMPSDAILQFNQAIKDYKEKIKQNPDAKDLLPKSAELLVEGLSRDDLMLRQPNQKQLYAQVAPKAQPFYQALIRKEKAKKPSNSNRSEQSDRSEPPATNVNGGQAGVNLAQRDRQDPAAASQVPYPEALVLKATTMSSKQKWALAPLTTLPTHPSLVLSSLEVRTFYKLLLGVPLLNQPAPPVPASCVCNAARLSSTQRVLHSHFCRSSSCRTLQVMRHNSIKDDVAKIFKMVGVPVDVERVVSLSQQQQSEAKEGDDDDDDGLVALVAPNHASRQKKNHRPDLTINFPNCPNPIIADVVVTCPIAPSQVEKSATSANAAVNKASEAKITKYKELATRLNAVALPLAFDTHGALGPLVPSLGELFAAHAHESSLEYLFQYEKPLDFFMRAITCALCRGNAKVVQGQLNSKAKENTGSPG